MSVHLSTLNSNLTSSLSKVRTEHVLKTWPQFYYSIIDPKPATRKTLEIRFNDRGFRLGDILVLQEYDSTFGYTGREVKRLITHVLDQEPWVPEGYVAMSICEVSD